MSRISDAAWEVAQGARRAPNSGYASCLSNARMIADQALGFGVYAKYGNGWDPAYKSPTAATAELVWRSKGLSVPRMAPGDFLFTAGDSSAGHVGIFLGTRNGVAYVLENTYANRGQIVGGQQYIRLTPLSQFGTVRTIIRFPEDTKTASDLQQASGGGVVDTPAPAAPPGATAGEAGTPVGQALASVGIDFTGLGIGTKDFTGYRENPDWLYNTIEGFTQGKDPRAPSASMTNFGSVRGTVILRTPYADEMEQAMPFMGPMLISAQAVRDELLKRFNTLKRQYFATESWGKYYAPLYRLATSQDPGVYRFPLPDVSSVSYRQDAGGAAVAEVELHVSGVEEGEALYATLSTVSMLKNALVEVWVPMTYYDAGRKDGQAEIVYPAFVGVVEEVSANPYPHGIRFRVVPQDHYVGGRGINPDEGVPNSWPKDTPLYQIIQDIAKAYRITVFTPSAIAPGDLTGLSGLKQLQTLLDAEYNALYRPPMDVIREIVERSAGLRLTRLFGFELLGKTVGPTRGLWMIYDPLAYTPLTPGFWKNALWVNLTSKVFGFLTGNGNLVGEVTVFYPDNLPWDPKQIKRMAAILDTYAPDEARATPWRRLIDTISAGLSAVGVGSGPAVKAAYDGQAKTAMIEAINEWYASSDADRTPTQKWLVPALSIEDLTTRTPTDAELANPIFGTVSGQTGQRGTVTTAEKAANLLQANQSKEGGWLLQTPSGQQAFASKDKVYVYYAANMSRPSMVVPVNRSGEVDDAQGKFYPYTLTLRCKPMHGVRVGGVAVLIGHGRLDGHWEIQSVQHTLSGSDQELVVTLRTARAIYLV